MKELLVCLLLEVEDTIFKGRHYTKNISTGHVEEIRQLQTKWNLL